MDTGNKIRVLRESKGFSQEEIALKVGYKTKDSISKIENGGQDCPEKRLEKIAAVFDMTLTEFYSYDPDKILTVTEKLEPEIEIVRDPRPLYIINKKKEKKSDYISENQKLIVENNILKTILTNHKIDLSCLESE